MIPLSVPNICGNEWDYIKECLDTGWVSSAGKYVDLFEDEICKYTGSRYAVACVNGTAALQISLMLAGVKHGDMVIVPSLTFIAPVNAITYNGAKPIFMDVDKYYNIDVEKTIDFIKNETFRKDGKTFNKNTNQRISAILPIHMWGNAAQVNELSHICKERKINIVEDASESLGTTYKSNKISKLVHTGTIGSLGCLSFNGNKIITTGGGGMILTDSEKLFRKARYLTTQAKDDPIRYIHNEIGYNYRLTNIQAALGVAQLEQLPSFLKRKKSIYQKYKTEINKINGLKIATVPNYSNNNHWMILLQIDEQDYGKNREELMLYLEKNKIQTRPAWAPIHRQEPYKNCQTYRIEITDYLVQKSLCLPSSTNIKDIDIDNVIGLINE